MIQSKRLRIRRLWQVSYSDYLRYPKRLDLILKEPFVTCIQTVNFETWDRYRYWAAHVKGATALLELRGQKQFTRERGGQLYVQIRSQIMSPAIHVHSLAEA